MAEEKVGDDEFTPEEFEKAFDLNKALGALAQDSEKQIQLLARDEEELANIRQKIQRYSRKNFILEKDLNDIDEKIKLLVKHRITLQEAMSSMSHDMHDKEASALAGKREAYETLFYILQTKPRYFAKLARLIAAKEIPSFVQTVVFDMYGDQYNTREERLLLDIFKRVLRDELMSAADQGSLLRANTAITQMLSAYAKRGQGLALLRDVLEEPLLFVTKQKDLNLEINPMKIYNQLITEYETKTGKTCDWPRNIDGQKAAERPEVIEELNKRLKTLEEYANMFLQRILDGVDAIPYGMRWICKQLGVLCKERFPNATRYQVGSLMGGYIYLRFFNPVIVTPDAINFIKTKPSRIMRRNLILIAKILQNLSNGLLFKDKEFYMKPLNSFIEEKKQPLMEYFDRLTNVDDLQDALQIDKYLEHTSRNNSINISLNQIFLIHDILLRHKDKVCGTGTDAVRKLLDELGDAPSQLKKQDNRQVVLQLQSRKQRLSTAADAFAMQTKAVNPLYNQAKILLLSVLRLLPSSTNTTSLEDFLNAEKEAAVKQNDGSLADHIANVSSMLHTLADVGNLTQMGSTTSTFNFFLWETARDAMERQRRLPIVRKRLKLVKPALKSIQEHHRYLMERLELYRMYLDNVRQGGGGMGASSSGDSKEKDKKSKKKKKKELPKYKATHAELVDTKVITHVDPKISKSILKKCYYLFTMTEPGMFEITLHLKKGMDIRLLKKPIELKLEDLLKDQSQGKHRIQWEVIELNVNLLIHLLNTKLLYKK